MNISITYVLSNSWFMFDEKPLEIFRSASSRCNGIFTLALNNATPPTNLIMCNLTYLDTMRCWPLWPQRPRGLFSEQF